MSNLIFAGIDIGSRAAKGVLMRDNEIIATVIRDTGPESVKTAYAVRRDLLAQAGCAADDIDYTVATGYGRVLVPFAAENVSEISCHAKGINWYFPSVKTVLDMGGQDCKAISLDGGGVVEDFVMNDKCAGGTGRFLEMIADVLGVPLAEIGRTSLSSSQPVPFNTICAVFAKTDAIRYQRKGTRKEDILNGLHEAIAVRSLNLLKRVGIKPDFSITGGISKNSGMVAKMAEKVGMEPRLCEDPQLIGALGAALFAAERFRGGSVRPLRAQYGYSDATGDYYITVDGARCDGCGDCADFCPEDIFMVAETDGGAVAAMVQEKKRKSISMLCPGAAACKQKHGQNCQTVCPQAAISHSW